MSRRISREIGWSEQSILLYKISKQIDALLRLYCACAPITSSKNLLLENGNDLFFENNEPIILEN